MLKMLHGKAKDEQWNNQIKEKLSPSLQEEIPFQDAAWPLPFVPGLEYNSPAHGTWNIVHMGMLLPGSHQIYVCGANCNRGVILTASEMNAGDRFSFVEIKEEDLFNGQMEDLVIEGVSDILHKLPKKPSVVLLFTVCVHHFMGCDLAYIYDTLRSRFPEQCFVAGDCLEILKTLPEDSVHCCVTSPPYYALRDYGMEAQIGRETTPKEYISRLTEVFTEVRRVLRPDGTLWLNISDTYAGKGNQGDFIDPKNPTGRNGQAVALNNKVEGCKPKDMIGIPWMLAFALRDTGWYLRNDIIWMKDNPMPESVKDRCARCYEHIFLFSKSKKYFFDYKAISEPIAPATAERLKRGMKGGNKYGKPVPGQPQPQSINRPREHGEIKDCDINPLRNKRDVWKINTVPFKGGHYAAYPPKLVETCLLAGCPEGGIVLDPFMGSGTTGMVASQMGRHFVGVELNPEYTELAYKRIGGEI